MALTTNIYHRKSPWILTNQLIRNNFQQIYPRVRLRLPHTSSFWTISGSQAVPKRLLLLLLLLLFVKVTYRVIQRASAVETYVRRKFYGRCCSKFRSGFSALSILSKSAMYWLVHKFRTEGSFLKNRETERLFLSEERLDSKEAHSEYISTKIFVARLRFRDWFFEAACCDGVDHLLTSFTE